MKRYSKLLWLLLLLSIIFFIVTLYAANKNVSIHDDSGCTPSKFGTPCP